MKDDDDFARFGCLFFTTVLTLSLIAVTLLACLIRKGSAKDGKKQINTRGSVSGSVEAEFP